MPANLSGPGSVFPCPQFMVVWVHAANVMCIDTINCGMHARRLTRYCCLNGHSIVVIDLPGSLHQNKVPGPDILRFYSLLGFFVTLKMLTVTLVES